MERLLSAAADLLLGACCPACGAPGWSLCGRCRGVLDGTAPQRITRAGVGPRLISAHDYRPVLSGLIPRYKDDGAWQLAGWLGGRLAVAVAALEPGPETVLVPVPSLPSAVRSRGLDHMGRLTAVAAARLALRSAALLRRRSGADQRGLGRLGRRANMLGAMVPRPPRHGPPAGVILCDDVVTTGSTLAEATRVLRKAGIEVRGAAVIAVADHDRSRHLVEYRS